MRVCWYVTLRDGRIAHRTFELGQALGVIQDLAATYRVEARLYGDTRPGLTRVEPF